LLGRAENKAMMNERAWFLNGYEHHEGELDLRLDALRFNRLGVFAAFGLLGLALTSPYQSWITIPRCEIRGSYPSPMNDREFAVYTTREMLVFVVGPQNRRAWLEALGPFTQPAHELGELDQLSVGDSSVVQMPSRS
jgi:hypothetical protein